MLIFRYIQTKKKPYPLWLSAFEYLNPFKNVERLLKIDFSVFFHFFENGDEVNKYSCDVFIIQTDHQTFRHYIYIPFVEFTIEWFVLFFEQQ